MSIGSVSAYAAAGLHWAGASMEKTAASIASGGLEVTDIVDLRTAEHAFSANAVVLRTADEMAGRLLDVLA